MPALVNLILGLAILLKGRELFWLFVGAMGFLAGFRWGMQALASDTNGLVWLIALGVGVLGALLAGFMRRVAVALAGFVAGSYLLVTLLHTLSWETSIPENFFLLLGGLLGAVLVTVTFDWALIGLSALLGATLLTQTLVASLTVQPLVAIITLILLTLLGIGIQRRDLNAVV